MKLLTKTFHLLEWFGILTSNFLSSDRRTLGIKLMDMSDKKSRSMHTWQHFNKKLTLDPFSVSFWSKMKNSILMKYLQLDSCKHSLITTAMLHDTFGPLLSALKVFWGTWALSSPEWGWCWHYHLKYQKIFRVWWDQVERSSFHSWFEFFFLGGGSDLVLVWSPFICFLPKPLLLAAEEAVAAAAIVIIKLT